MKTLTTNGYKEWDKETDQFDTTTKYQKRVDTLDQYEHYPLCYCNDKLFINVTYYDFLYNGTKSKSYTMSLTHENQDGDWCDLKIYGLTEEKITANLEKYERKLLDMWNLFYEGELK